MAVAPADRMEWFRRGEIESSTQQLAEILNTGIFDATILHPLLMSAVTQILILLNDLLQKANLDGRRISFLDDVQIEGKPEADVTDLIRDMRNAACHIPSGLRDLNGNRLSFNIFKGYIPNAMLINGVRLGCDYADDLAINYGGMRLYVRRHIIRAFQEVVQGFIGAGILGQR